jgi:hypothetical protein
VILADHVGEGRGPVAVVETRPWLGHRVPLKEV